VWESNKKERREGDKDMKRMKERNKRDEGNEDRNYFAGNAPTHRCYDTVRRMAIEWINKRKGRGDKVRKG
jgi:hypothetical protein